MIKNTILVLSAAALLCACNNDQKHSDFEIKGSLSNSSGETVYLERLSQSQPLMIDSAKVDDKGNFVLNGASPSLGFYRLKINDANFSMLVLDSTEKISLKGNAKDLGNTYTVEGSPNTALFLEYDKMAQRHKSSIDSIENIFRTYMVTMKLDSLKADSLSKELQKPYESLVKSYSDRLAEKIRLNNMSFASIMAIQQLNPEEYIDVYTMLDKGLAAKYPGNGDIKKFHTMVEQTQSMVSRSKAIAEGQEAPEINLPMPNGKSLALSALRGKVVLIDFWASWCGPCRKEMPNVKRVYEKYKKKGFEIYGVSLDQEKDAWLQAIAKDGITWPQVSDLKYWSSEAAQTYAVQGIPFTVLVDKNGKIIAKNLRGEELDKKLAEVLK